jgi:hypothetical protein
LGDAAPAAGFDRFGFDRFGFDESRFDDPGC